MNTARYRYNQQVQPAAPCVYVVIRHPIGQVATERLPGLLDRRDLLNQFHITLDGPHLRLEIQRPSRSRQDLPTMPTPPNRL
jgi:hypothetical protein